jgi:hypothetical protein
MQGYIERGETCQETREEGGRQIDTERGESKQEDTEKESGKVEKTERGECLQRDTKRRGKQSRRHGKEEGMQG